MRALLASFVAALLLAPSTSAAATILIDFEGVTEFTALSNQYAGVTFTNATVLTAGSSLNGLEFPPHSGTNVAYNSDATMSVAFTSAVSSFSAYFTYLTPLTLTAYDASNAVIASASSTYTANFTSNGLGTPNELISLTALGITRVDILGGGGSGSFVVDDITADITSTDVTPVPEPASLLLLGSGLAGSVIAARRRRKQQNAA